MVILVSEGADQVNSSTDVGVVCGVTHISVQVY